MDILDITKEIFNKPIKKPFEIHLDFSDPNKDSKDSGNLDFLFKQLLIIFTEGMKILYGDNNKKVNLTVLTETDFEKVNRYFNSFGFRISYHIEPKESKYEPNVGEKKNLKDFFLRLRTEYCLYFISFDQYK